MGMFDFLKENEEACSDANRTPLNPNVSAFPCPSGCLGENGLTVREHFALHLMAAITSYDNNATDEWAAELAVRRADHLIKELNK